MTLHQEIGVLLRQRGYRLAVAESCMGGLIASRVTSVAGSSDYFPGGVIAYSNEVKVAQLGVDAWVLKAKGAVSREVSRQMAEGIRRIFRANVGLSVTGIAGPGGVTPKKPVGLVYIGLAYAGGCRVKKYVFSGTRGRIRRQTSETALMMLREFLIKR
jgi:nicotinamide-nucleotide amidase